MPANAWAIRTNPPYPDENTASAGTDGGVLGSGRYCYNRDGVSRAVRVFGSHRAGQQPFRNSLFRLLPLVAGSVAPALRVCSWVVAGAWAVSAAWPGVPVLHLLPERMQP